ncbi:MAG TPA: copper chaperone PCu(A)C [Mariprofundaceae bacterium]|nr:copper chaperone PCu(A)C [Mariprofundaceae bacterium]
MKKMLLIALLMLPFSAAAAELQVKDGWVRLVPPVADTTAAYVTLANPGDAPVVIVGVASDVAGMAMLHAMTMQNGRMEMSGLERLEVPAHGEVSLAPGGNHIMLMELKHALAAGDAVELTLQYGDGTTQKLTLKVVDARGHMGQGMGMHHGGN